MGGEEEGVGELVAVDEEGGGEGQVGVQGAAGFGGLEGRGGEGDV